MTRTTIEVAEVASPVGDVEMAFRAGRVCALAFARGEVRLEHVIARRFGSADCRSAAGTPAAASKLRRYFEGELGALQAIPVDLDGTPFQLEVWTALRSISPGQTASYQDVARAIGRPHAARAVGTATGANPIGLVIPCHRVVLADGALGGYGGGIERKRWLLEHEQSRVSQRELRPQSRRGRSEAFLLRRETELTPAAAAPRRTRDLTSTSCASDHAPC